jgi:copper(I)-binding protein
MVSSPALAGPITVVKPWAEMMAGEQDRGDIFFTIVNNGTAPDRLYAVKTPVAKRAVLETESEAEVLAGVENQATALEVKAGERLVLDEDGAHIELFGLSRQLEEGQTFPATLYFEQAGEIRIEVEVE